MQSLQIVKLSARPGRGKRGENLADQLRSDHNSQNVIKVQKSAGVLTPLFWYVMHCTAVRRRLSHLTSGSRGFGR